jgi:hypothetical protein
MDTMKNPSGRRYAYLALGLVVITWLVMDFNGRMSQLRRITAEREVVSADLINQMETRAALEEQIIYAKSDKFVEAYAYMDAHEVRSGDQRIILVPDSQSTPQPAPLPMVVVTESNNIQNWMALFTGP